VAECCRHAAGRVQQQQQQQQQQRGPVTHIQRVVGEEERVNVCECVCVCVCMCTSAAKNVLTTASSSSFRHFLARGGYYSRRVGSDGSSAGCFAHVSPRRLHRGEILSGRLLLRDSLRGATSLRVTAH